MIHAPSSDEPSAARRTVRMREDWLARVALICGTVAAYWPVLQCQFVNYDDPLYLTENSLVRQGLSWEGLQWALTATRASNWHPLTWLSHMIDCQAFGLGPIGPHCVNLSLHILNAVLVFELLRRLTTSFWPSLLVGSWFAIHPVHVESVAWVAERKDVLSTLFFLLTIWAYARYTEISGLRVQAKSKVQDPSSFVKSATEDRETKVQNPKPRSSIFYLLSVAFFTLGLMSKPMLVTLPVLLLLLDYWPLKRLLPHCRQAQAGRGPGPTTSPPCPQQTTWGVLVEKIPFLILSAISCGVTMWAQRAGGSILSLENLPIQARISNALLAYWRYVGKIMWPAKLAVFYPFGPTISGGVVLVAGAALAALTLSSIRLRRHPWVAFGWLWFLGALVPVIGLVQVGTQAMADRYTYIPSIGLFVVASFGLAELWAKWSNARNLLALLAVGTVVMCFWATRRQVGVWQDSETLFRHAIAVTKNNSVAYNNLGTALQSQGRVNEAVECYQEAIRLKPDQSEAHDNLGQAFMNQGRLEEAERHLLLALEYQPNSPSARYNLATLRVRQGRVEEAIASFRRAVVSRPDFAAAHNNLGCLLGAQAKSEEAVEEFRSALRYSPNDAMALNNLGSMLTDQGRAGDAIAPLSKALKINPTYADAHYNLGRAWDALNKRQPAAAEYEAAINLDSNHSLAHYRLGNLFFSDGAAREAVQQYQSAVFANPAHAESHYQLGVLLVANREAPEGIEHYRQAVRLKPDWVEALNNLAWNLAVQPEASLRNGELAVALASRAVQLTRANDAEALDTLAAAYAEAGCFAEAISAAKRGLALAQAAGQKELSLQMSDRLRLYLAHKPCREP